MLKAKKTLLILGGTSAVAIAYARRQALHGRAICLVGRNEENLKKNQADLIGRGASDVSHYICNLSDLDLLKNHWEKIISKTENGIDEVLLAYGVLSDQVSNQDKVDQLRADLETNFVSAALWSELAFSYFGYEGCGQLTVIGSVAGDRGRQSNYHYGAAKGGLEIFCEGLSHRAAHVKEAKISVLCVKPGFIDTPMTDGLNKGGPLWATPDKIAAVIDRAISQKKQKIYAPWFWGVILFLIRLTPRFVFHKTKL
ncbi:MAG: SDR family NAD(P)-dependent oxidoreductase [Maricaulaceae bacterium]